MKKIQFEEVTETNNPQNHYEVFLLVLWNIAETHVDGPYASKAVAKENLNSWVDLGRYTDYLITRIPVLEMGKVC